MCQVFQEENFTENPLCTLGSTTQSTPKTSHLRFHHVQVFTLVSSLRVVETVARSATYPPVDSMTSPSSSPNPLNWLPGVHEGNILSISLAFSLRNSSNAFRVTLAQISPQLMRDNSWEDLETFPGIVVPSCRSCWERGTPYHKHSNWAETKLGTNPDRQFLFGCLGFLVVSLTVFRIVLMSGPASALNQTTSKSLMRIIQQSWMCSKLIAMCASATTSCLSQHCHRHP